MNDIDYRRSPNHPDPHQRRPIGRTRRYGNRVREATEHHDETRIHKREGVDGCTPSAETPSGRREGLLSDTFEQDATDGDHVGGEQGEEGEGDDNIEGGSGAEVDEADDAGADRS